MILSPRKRKISTTANAARQIWSRMTLGRRDIGRITSFSRAAHAAAEPRRRRRGRDATSIIPGGGFLNGRRRREVSSPAPKDERRRVGAGIGTVRTVGSFCRFGDSVNPRQL